jgi:hypothetical protein
MCNLPPNAFYVTTKDSIWSRNHEDVGFLCKGFIFGDRPIKIVLDFEIKFLDYCFVAFGI